ncbi:MAG TPA: hypothetical protein VEU51_12735, partial [Candidatus Acidoferrales bacterium]|nr:hypothetical protein [Candidatus Acidoferrales bacterium]
MSVTELEGVESIRVIRADGNLTIAGGGAPLATVESSVKPEITRSGGVAEISIRANATISVPAGVSVAVEDVAGNLDVTGVASPLTVQRVRGNLNAERIAAMTIADSIGGNACIKDAAALEGRSVRGSLAIDSARTVTFGRVSGHFDCREIAGEVTVEKISGGARLRNLHGPFIARLVGGNLEVEEATDAEAGVVGGKVRASKLSGAIRMGKIGGKLSVEDVAGDVAVGFVGGHARLRKVRGAMTLEEVGGAVDLSGPYPPAKEWNVQGRGRVNVELDENAALDLDAATGWGRIRIHGIEAAGLQWLGRNHIHGPLGPEPSAGARLKLTVETRSGDVILASAAAHERDFSGRGYRTGDGRGFSAPLNDLFDEIGEEVPAFVRTVLDAAGKFVAESGGSSSRIVRDVTRDVTRGVSAGLREVERALGEIEESVPAAVGAKLSSLGKEIGDLVSQTVRGGSREARHEMRDRVREAAREMRDTIRDAARDLRNRPRREDAAPGADTPGTSKT